MTTALWIALCAIGLLAGFVGGFGYRRRKTTIDASTRRVDPIQRDGEDQASAEGSAQDLPDTPDQDGVVSTPDFSASKVPDHRPAPVEDDHEASVIDLRRPKSIPTRPIEPTPTRSAPATAAPPTRTDGPNADVIDLRERSQAAVAVHNLQFVKGIGPGLDLELRRHGIITVADFVALDNARIDELAQAIEAFRPKRVRTKLQPRAAAMLEAAAISGTAAPPDTTGLRRVHGIGSTMARWLETQGITTLDQLAALDDDAVGELQSELSAFPNRITDEHWVDQARRLTRTRMEST